jgi:NADPH:quinone reductase-like Zn-dependent oxidoreductase
VDWQRVRLKSAALNHHDLWTLKGQATALSNLPIVLGSDGVGLTDSGDPVLIHAVIGNGVDETLDPKRSLLSEIHDGTLAEEIWVPAENLIALPSYFSWNEAACLPTAWLTAYRMLFTKGHVQAGDTVLVQGVSGGVASAAISLARAAGATVWVTSRDAAKSDFAKSIGAHEVFETGTKLPAKVDLVIESVGQATWDHSMRALRPGGKIVVCGATSGANPPADLNRLFFLQLEVIGSTMGTRNELRDLLTFMQEHDLRPTISQVWHLADTLEAFTALATGNTFGKLVIEIS